MLPFDRIYPSEISRGPDTGIPASLRQAEGAETRIGRSRPQTTKHFQQQQTRGKEQQVGGSITKRSIRPG